MNLWLLFFVLLEVQLELFGVSVTVFGHKVTLHGGLIARLHDLLVWLLGGPWGRLSVLQTATEEW